MNLQITTSHFTGTLAELVEAIQDDQVDILDVSLTKVTASFISYLAENAALPIVDAVTIHFYTTQLLLIKAQYLLNDEEEVDTVRLREEVIDVLIEFQRLKKLSDELRRLQTEDLRPLVREDKRRSILRHYPRSSRALPPMASRDPHELSRRIHDVAAKLLITRALPPFTQFSLPLMRARLLQLIERKQTGVLSDLLDNETEHFDNEKRRAQLISALLVVLVEVQRHMITARQPQPFYPVTIQRSA